MRCVVVAMMAVGLAQSALAADYGPLRGSTGFDQPIRVLRWDGVYGGGQAGYSTAGFDFGSANRSQIAYLERQSVLSGVADWTTLGKGDTVGWSYGAFVGYNFQYDDVVLGVEASYNRGQDLGLSASDSLGPLILTNPGGTPPPNTTIFYHVTVTAAASAKINDVATFRGRLGWATGGWLPYAFAGVAVGRADIMRSSQVDWYRTQRVTNPNDGTFVDSGILSSGTDKMAESRQNVFIYGYTLGLGFDYALTQNIFARAEWEWVDFRSNDIKMHTNSVRGGLGVKF